MEEEEEMEVDMGEWPCLGWETRLVNGIGWQ